MVIHNIMCIIINIVITIIMISAIIHSIIPIIIIIILIIIPTNSIRSHFGSSWFHQRVAVHRISKDEG